jgi:hypothetical protein
LIPENIAPENFVSTLSTCFRERQTFSTLSDPLLSSGDVLVQGALSAFRSFAFEHAILQDGF